MIDVVTRALQQRLQGIVGIATVTAPARDDGPLMRQQVSLHPDGLLRDATAISSLFGFGSSAPVNSRVLYLALGGDRSKIVVIGTLNAGSRVRNLQPGETVVYNAHGMSIRLSAAGVTVDGGGQPVTFSNATKARFEMPIESTGEVTAMADGAFVHLSTHQTTNVQSGAGTSGPPKPNT